MDPHLITCDACGKTAFVREIRYHYAAEYEPGQPANEHRLVKTEWEIDCPSCGVRSQSESFDGGESE
jgi:hypothetical protein